MCRGSESNYFATLYTSEIGKCSLKCCWWSIVRSFLYTVIPVQENACDTHQYAVTETVIGIPWGITIARGERVPKKWRLVGAMRTYTRTIIYVFVRTFIHHVAYHGDPWVVPDGDEGWVPSGESKTLWGEAHKCHVYVRGASPPLTSVYRCVPVLMSWKQRNRIVLWIQLI